MGHDTYDNVWIDAGFRPLHEFDGAPDGRRVAVCAKGQRGTKPYRVVVLDNDGRVLIEAPDKKSPTLRTATSGKLLGGTGVVYANIASQWPTVALLDIAEPKLKKTFCNVRDGQLIALDVDPTGRYVIVGWLDEDPDCPNYRLYDHHTAQWTDLDTTDLIDASHDSAHFGDSVNTLIVDSDWCDGTPTIGIDPEAGVATWNPPE